MDAESWYNKQIPPADRARRHDEYDRYLRDEMLPYITSRTGGNIVTVGASFGAYHAANVAARYPGVVTKAICFSGLYDVYQFLDGYWDDTLLLPHADGLHREHGRGVEGEASRRSSGSSRPARTTRSSRQNREFAALLERQGQRVQAEFWPGVFGHDWPFWKEHIRRFI